MKSIKNEIAHAIIFINDPNNSDIEIPEYKNDTIISFNKDCISVGTQSPYDGETEIILAHFGEIESGLIKIFSGKILSHSGKLAVFSSENKNLLEIDTKVGDILIVINVDNIYYPSKIVIEV
jgi:hypothetical protein